MYKLLADTVHKGQDVPMFPDVQMCNVSSPQCLTIFIDGSSICSHCKCAHTQILWKLHIFFPHGYDNRMPDMSTSSHRTRK